MHVWWLGFLVGVPSFALAEDRTVEDLLPDCRTFEACTLPCPDGTEQRKTWEEPPSDDEVAAMLASGTDPRSLPDTTGWISCNGEQGLQGPEMTFRRDGSRELLQTWKDGSEHGPTAVWNAAGKLVDLSMYEAGALHGPSRRWSDAGILIEEEHYRQGERHGKYASWYDDGARRAESTWKEGKQDGVSREWYPDGTLGKEHPWREGVRDGAWRMWYPSGQPVFSFHFNENRPTGTAEAWYEDGKRWRRESFSDDASESETTLWYPSGKWGAKVRMEKGKFASGKCRDQDGKQSACEAVLEWFDKQAKPSL